MIILIFADACDMDNLLPYLTATARAMPRLSLLGVGCACVPVRRRLCLRPLPIECTDDEVVWLYLFIAVVTTAPLLGVGCACVSLLGVGCACAPYPSNVPTTK